MKKWWVVLGVVLVVAAAIIWWVAARLPDAGGTEKAATPQEEVSSTQEEIPIESQEPTLEEVFNSLSLPTFAQQTFSGSEFTVGEVLARTDAYTRYYITYKSGELKISGIMNVPTGKGPFPVLFLNHGYIDPAIYTNGRGLKREQDYLVRHGYVVVHSDYRNHADSDKDPDAEVNLRLGYAEDVINGIGAIKAANLPYVNANKIGLLGHSMGGGVSEIIAVTKPELADAIVLFAPVSADVRDNFNKWTKTRPEVASKIIAMYGAPDTNASFWDGVSPITFLDKVKAPIMIHHGTEDESVPLEWSQRLADELEGKGKDVAFHIYPGEPHEFVDAWPQVMSRTVQFFDKHLK